MAETAVTLGGVWAKVHRAQEQTNLLEGEIGRDHHHSIVAWTELDEQTSNPIVPLLPQPTDTLVRWSVIAGEVIYNLRSALDYLAYELCALDNGGVYFEDSQFPLISEDAPRTSSERPSTREVMERGWRNRETLSRLTDTHQAIIERYQPYEMPWSGYVHDDPLGVLANLANKDKHRLPVVTYRTPQSGIQTTVLNRQDIDGVHGFAIRASAKNARTSGGVRRYRDRPSS
jgi:hypothetical protein